MPKEMEMMEEGQSVKGKSWTDEELLEAMGRELIDFDDRPAAMEDARRRWALFERLRALPGDYASWADLPAQEAFEDLSQQWFERSLQLGQARARDPSPLPQKQARAIFRAPPVSAAGQALLEGASRVEPFQATSPLLALRSGDTSLAQAALGMGLEQASKMVSSGQWSAIDLARSFEARAALSEPALGSLESVCAPPSEAHPQGTLAGMPYVAKSLFWVEGELASASSKMLSRFMAPADAPVVAGLRAAGAAPWAMARMDEFAMGSDGSRSAWGATRHPMHPERLPGGSSSGSAAALAAGLCMFSIGSDTGGSVRIPASHCGLFGLKPTYGALSRFGMVPYAFSLDCPGAFARRADDLAIVYEGMASGQAGWDERQRLWSPEGFASDARAWALRRDPKAPWCGLRIGVERSWVDGCDELAVEAFGQWEIQAKALGAQIVDVGLPMADKAVWAYYLLACCEAQSSLAKYDPSRLGWESEAETWPDWESSAIAARKALIGREPRLRALLGAMALGESSRQNLYAKACGLRRELALQWGEVFGKVDVVASPTTASPAPIAGAPMSEEHEWAQDRLTIPASLGGICAASAPWARRSDGHDMGIQLCAPWHGEKALLGWMMAWKS
jgi:aspartyl-tRNA(Asn)/glutamyl-tRNA(Gln) amidotransferase subunit A